MDMIVYCNGEFLTYREANLSIFDHGFLYGDGLVEDVRCYDGRLFCFDEHIDHLMLSAKLMGLHIPPMRTLLQKTLTLLVKHNQLKNAILRIVITRGEGTFGYQYVSSPEITTLVIPQGIAPGISDACKRGVVLITSRVRSIPKESMDPRIGSLGQINRMLAHGEARNNHMFDVVMLNSEGYVTGTAFANLFVVLNGRLVTPDGSAGVYNGVTRKVISEVAVRAGLESVETLLGLDDVYVAEECFLSSSEFGMVPVVQVDGRAIGTGKVGKVTQMLRDRFREYVRRSATSSQEQQTLNV